MVPVFPLKLNVVLFVFAHTVADPLMVPPILDSTVIFIEPVYTIASTLVRAPLL